MGLFGKGKDFWDEVDDPSVEDSGRPMTDNGSSEDDIGDIDDGRWHPTKSTPLKVITRLLLFVSAVVVVISGLKVYTYFSNGGTMTSEPDYYHSSYFGEEYQNNVVQLIRLVQAIEARGTVSGDGQEQVNQDLIANYLTADGNFSFVVYDDRTQEVVSSSEDAVKRIEASYYFVRLDTTKGSFDLNCGMRNDALDESVWKEELTSCAGTYTIYAAVDNELTSTADGFYESYQDFKDMIGGFGLARTAVIAAAVVFVLMLIFCIVATGNVKGYSGIRLTWFDKIFTEIAIILIIAFGGGSIFGAYYLYTSALSFGTYGAYGALVLAYIFIIRGYFSMVRRIKSGTFISNMLIYRIFEAIGSLPTVPRVLLLILVLVLLNGALVLALFTLDSYEIMGIPLVYIVVPVIFVLENICFISWVIRKGNAEYEDEISEDEEAEETPAVEGDTMTAGELEQDLSKASAMAVAQETVRNDDWEHMDLGPSVDMAIGSDNMDMDGELDKKAGEGDETVVLPKEEIESLLGAATIARDSATSFDFIQLNRDIRKLHRSVLKESGITVTLRAPEKPIILEMNKEDMWKAISMIYDNLEQYAEPDSRVYAEMYTQNGKLIYIVKNAVKAEAAEASKRIADGAELTGGLKIAKEIIEKNHGKFVVAMDGNIFKTGILLSLVQE